MKRPLLFGLIGAALAVVGAGTLFSGTATAVLPEGIVAAVGPAQTDRRPDLGSFTLVATKGVDPAYAAHAKIPAKLAPPQGPAAAIVGGRVSDLTGIPGAVLIEAVTEESDGLRAFQQCTGTITTDLGPEWVITAAHCIEEGAVRFDIYYGGEGDGATRGTMRRLWGHRAYIPLDYKRSTLRGDVALIRLVEAADLRPHEMARFATDVELRQIKSGDDVIGAGWGTTEGGDASGVDPSKVLKEVSLTIRSVSPLAMAAASARNAVEGTCQGDSGGSLRWWRDRRVVLGFLSYVDRLPSGVCRAPGYVSAFTGVGYLKWIAGLL